MLKIFILAAEFGGLGVYHGVSCLRLSMLTDIAKPDLHQFGSCASATLGLQMVNWTAIFGTGPAV